MAFESNKAKAKSYPKGYKKKNTRRQTPLLYPSYAGGENASHAV